MTPIWCVHTQYHVICEGSQSGTRSPFKVERFVKNVCFELAVTEWTILLTVIGWRYECQLLYHKWCCVWWSSWWNTESYAARRGSSDTQLDSVNIYFWSRSYNDAKARVAWGITPPLRVKMVCSWVRWNCYISLSVIWIRLPWFITETNNSNEH